MSIKRILPALAAVAFIFASTYSCVKADIPEDPSEEIPEEKPDSSKDDPNSEPDDQPEEKPDDQPIDKTGKAFPVIRISTDGFQEVYSKTEYITGKIAFEDPDGFYSDVPLVECGMRIRGRGNTTWGLPKKPYRIKLDEKNNIFGMKGDKDWVLLAEYNDGTLLRNTVSMEISRRCGMNWTPDCVLAEVYFNDRYEGVYTLIEHKETGAAKVNITPVTGAETDGGYYVELDDKDDDDLYFRTSTFYKKIKFKDPELPTQEQQAFIKNIINNIEKALDAYDFSAAAELIDLDSFVNYYIVQELTKNIDGNMRLSTFFARDKGTKIWLAHVWDFDWAIGNAQHFYEYGIDNGYSGWFIKDFGGRPFGYEYPNGQRSYYQCLFKDPTFVQAVKDRWDELYPELQTIPEYVNEITKYLDEPMKREYSAWPAQRRGVYSNEVNNMLDFYTNRLGWINTNIKKL